MRVGCGENQHRSSGGGRRDRGVHQGDAGGTTRDDPAESAFLAMESSYRCRVDQVFRSHAELPVANRGGAAPGGGVVVRIGRDERTRDHRAR
nr:hypothetical protein [Mycobacterium tuberculosis]